jgi:membrane protein DedA with SNARE-associated domain
MGYLWFSVATLAGAIPWNFVLAYAGFQLGQHWEVVATAMHPFVIPVGIGVVILLAVAWWFGRKLGEAEEAILEKTPAKG